MKVFRRNGVVKCCVYWAINTSGQCGNFNGRDHVLGGTGHNTIKTSQSAKLNTGEAYALIAGSVKPCQRQKFKIFLPEF